MKKTRSIVTATSKPALSIKTNVKAGIETRLSANHSAKATKAASTKTHIKAGLLSPNHSATMTKA